MANPTRQHGEAVKRIGRYLMDNRDKGLIIRPDPDKGLQCYVDADFCGNWDKDQFEDPSTARSRHGFIVKYASVPLYWMSKLQIQFVVSTTESEYIGLSKACLYVKGTIYLLEEIKEKFEPKVSTVPTVVLSNLG